ncbi:MAG: molybdate ABC transporter substrate-binding protein [Candidatus Eisenbacteria bacterium]
MAPPWIRARDAIVALLVGSALIQPFSAAAASHSKSTSAVTVTVFAAASLTEAFDELARDFETAHPGTTVRCSYAGSQQLAAQLAAGARADVFASADTRWMSDAVSQGRIDGEPRVFARNVLAVIVPAANPARIDRFQQLARPGVKLVICAASVPAGRYARELLSRLEAVPGAGPGWSAKVLANVVSEEDNVRGVVGKVALDEADAGIVYRSDLLASLRRAVRMVPVPDSLNVVAEYPLAVVKDAPTGALARAFADFVCSAEGQRVLAAHGFRAALATP